MRREPLTTSHGNADSHIDALCHVIFDGSLHQEVPAGARTEAGAEELRISSHLGGVPPPLLADTTNRWPGCAGPRRVQLCAGASLPERACGTAKGAVMAIGPVQLIVLGFSHPNFHGEIIEELERLHDSGTVRVIDALAVYKDADGELEAEHLSNLSEQEAIELGSKVGALIGLGFAGEEGAEAGAEAGAEEAAAEGINVLGGAEEWDVLEDIPNDSAAALILLEHHWAVPLRDAIARAGGFRLADGFISPLDLVGIGLMSAEEAKELHDLETSAAATR
jgi:uncharacterized membrane protein